MKLANESIEYTLGADLGTALFYGDTSGISDHEADELESFLDAIGEGVWELADDSEDYGCCEATGIEGSVHKYNFTPYE